MDKQNQKEVVKNRELTSVEKEMIHSVQNRGKVKDKDVFRVVQDTTSKSKIEMALDKNLSKQESLEEFQARIFEATGCINQLVGMNYIIKAGDAVTPSGVDVSHMVEKVNNTAQTAAAIGPNDEIEGQLILQLVVLHEQAMTLLGKATKTDRVDFANTYFNGASKLLARHHEALSALLKYRRGGEQHVHVEHVHVHNGGKAIVGSVGTGGGNQKNEEGPHAKV